MCIYGKLEAGRAAARANTYNRYDTHMKVGSEEDMGCKVACRWVAAVVKLRQLKLGALYEIYQ